MIAESQRMTKWKRRLEAFIWACADFQRPQCRWEVTISVKSVFCWLMCRWITDIIDNQRHYDRWKPAHDQMKEETRGFHLGMCWLSATSMPLRIDDIRLCWLIVSLDNYHTKRISSLFNGIMVTESHRMTKWKRRLEAFIWACAGFQRS